MSDPSRRRRASSSSTGRGQLADGTPASSGASSEPPDTRTLAALGKAAGEVAHDVDNALMAIVTHASLLRSEAPSASAVAHAEAILRAARAASDIVERVRQSLREGPTRPRVRIDLERLVADALVVAEARAAKKGVRIERVGLGAGGPGRAVAGQSAELLQLVTNLVNNAVDASEPGAVVRVELGADASAAHVEIVDQGPGIPEPLLERVFEPFFTTKGSGGTGLGLALARSIAEGHGGSVALHSRVHGPARGTTASVRLPLADPGEALPAEASATALELDGVAQGARVLIVDDDPRTRDALAILFQAAGFVATTATRVDEALAHAARRLPELVISDLQLGDGHGSELLAALQARAPGLPVIIVSGAAREPGPWQGAAAAVFDKPVSPARLIAKARELIARRRAQEHRP